MPIGATPASPAAGVSPALCTIRPPKDHAFDFTVPDGVSVDGVLDAICHLVGDLVHSIQHRGGLSFQVVVSSQRARDLVFEAGGVISEDVEVPLTPVSSTRTVYLTVKRLPEYVPDDALVRALAPYGSVQAFSFPVYKDRPAIRNGTRIVKFEMKRPVPNFLVVGTDRALVDYKGIKKVCGRCGSEGHIRSDCKVSRCERCAVFGHPTAGCKAPCLRCGSGHATVDCVMRRSYSSAAKGERPGLKPVSALVPAVSADLPQPPPALTVDEPGFPALPVPQKVIADRTGALSQVDGTPVAEAAEDTRPSARLLPADSMRPGPSDSPHGAIGDVLHEQPPISPDNGPSCQLSAGPDGSITEAHSSPSSPRSSSTSLYSLEVCEDSGSLSCLNAGTPGKHHPTSSGESDPTKRTAKSKRKKSKTVSSDDSDICGMSCS